MKSLDEAIEDSKTYGTVEFEGQTYFCTEEPWFNEFDDRGYWWNAAAVDSEGDNYIVQWVFDIDLKDRSALPWEDVFGVVPA